MTIITTFATHTGRVFEIVKSGNHYMAINTERRSDCSRSFENFEDAIHEAYQQAERRLPTTTR